MKIEFRHWDHTCSDGCCTDFGTEIYIDDVLVEHYNSDIGSAYAGLHAETAVLSVLKHLKIEYENND